MIKVKTPLGEFELNKGKFIKGDGLLRMLYEMAIEWPFQVSEGPEDFAIAARMTKYFNQDEIEILEERHPKREPGQTD